LGYDGIGELQSVDGYMNIALEKTQEFVDGKARRGFGDAFVRGNNGGFFFFPLFFALSSCSIPAALLSPCHSADSRTVMYISADS